VADEQLDLHSRRGRVALVATIAASAMASLDATIVNVALPHIGDDLNADVSGLQWVLTGYLLTLASLILVGGALGDRLGRRRMFVIGVTWFAAASLACGAAPSIGILIAARILQGVGGALLTPGSLAIIQTSFRAGDRAAAVGAWSGFGGVAGAIGPFLGGALVDGPGWRWAFLLNVPVAIVVIVCTFGAVPETRDVHAATRLDQRGAAYAAASLGAGTWALTEAGRRGWGDGRVAVATIISVVAGIAFVRHLQRDDAPLLPPDLFRDRTFSVVNIGTAFVYAAIPLAFFLTAFQLQVVAGWSALSAGVALLPATVLMLVLSSQSGALAQRIGPRAQLTVGPALVATGLLLLTAIDAQATWAADVLPGAVVLGLGLVTMVAPLTATVMASADPDHAGIASGVNNAVARTASLAALAGVPVVAGLTSAVGSTAITDACRIALLIGAALAAIASPVMFFGLAPVVTAPRTLRKLHCAVDGPPLQPDPAQCAPVEGAARN
jgi:EmrB/QacA subfamily drug resistance transporter